MLVRTVDRVSKQSSFVIVSARDAIPRSVLRSVLDAPGVAKPVLAEVRRRAAQMVPVPNGRSGCHG
jgi:hypothetical protein